MKHSLKLAALALASLAALATSAKAITTAQGDLILGVYNPSNTTSVYEADLGKLSLFSSTASLDLSSKVSESDIATIFGSTTGLDYFVVGTNGSSSGLQINGITPNDGSVLITDLSTVPSSDATTGNLGQPSSDISSLLGDLANQSAYSANSSVAADIVETAPKFGTPTFAFPSPLTTLVPFASSAPFDLLLNGTSRSTQGSVVLDGSFSFVNGTTFTFNPASAPEPSTYALMGLGALVLVLVLAARRRLASNS
jgi:hypothetical protein